MKLFIIRHGDPDYSIDSLTERGRREAALLCERLLGENITRVYCSPLGRARATAAPFLEATGLACEIRDWMQEFPYGVTQPLASHGLAESDRPSCCWDIDPRYFMIHQTELSDPVRWREHEMYKKGRVGEGVDKVYRGLDELLAENGYRRRGIIYEVDQDADRNANIALFCHMGLCILLLSRLAHISPPLAWQMFRVMPTSVSTILFTDIGGGFAQTKIFSVGDTSHLAPIGLTYRG
ncbi:MAG: histidine phosphatase family protein [Clostridiales bacterium]|jgi:broad specificity phosphatase PhoE|nr:histidine phosphatase family protein [Clostridiales bacterium]